MRDVFLLHMAALAEAGAHRLGEHHINAVCQALSRVERALALETTGQDGYGHRLWTALSSWGRVLVNQEDGGQGDGGATISRLQVGSWREVSRVCLRVAVRLAASLHQSGLLSSSEVNAANECCRVTGWISPIS